MSILPPPFKGKWVYTTNVTKHQPNVSRQYCMAFLMHKNALESRGESTCVTVFLRTLSCHLTSISPTLNFPRTKQERTLFHDVRRIWKTFSAVRSFLVSFAGKFDQNMERKYLNYIIQGRIYRKLLAKFYFMQSTPKSCGFKSTGFGKNAKKTPFRKRCKNVCNALIIAGCTTLRLVMRPHPPIFCLGRGNIICCSSPTQVCHRNR